MPLPAKDETRAGRAKAAKENAVKRAARAVVKQKEKDEKAEKYRKRIAEKKRKIIANETARKAKRAKQEAAKSKSKKREWPRNYTMNDYTINPAPPGIVAVKDETIWKRFPAPFQHYMISNMARIVNTSRKRPVVLKCARRTWLTDGTHKYNPSVTTLIGQAFLPPVPFAKPELRKVNKDGPAIASNLMYDVCDFRKDEAWNAIPYTDYEASNQGRVRNMLSGALRNPRVQDYLCVDLHGIWHQVQCAVAAAHIGPAPENKPTVNHKNGNKHDNRLCNLEYQSHPEQAKHAFETGLRKTKRTPVIAIDKEGNQTEYKSSREAAQNLGGEPGRIGTAIRNEETYLGRRWKYNGTPYRQEKAVLLPNEFFRALPEVKEHPEFKGASVSNFGRVQTDKGFIAKPRLSGKGYLTVFLKKRPLQVHRLVAFAFHGIPPNLNYKPDHIDMDPKNNTPENIRWSTGGDNTAAAIGVHIQVTNTLTKEVEVFKSIRAVARDFDVTPTTVAGWIRDGCKTDHYTFERIAKKPNSLPYDFVQCYLANNAIVFSIVMSYRS